MKTCSSALVALQDATDELDANRRRRTRFTRLAEKPLQKQDKQ
jgi:hypothetical protein